MKAVVYELPGRANGIVKEIPIPKIGPDEVLIKVMACSICKPAESSHDRETGSLLGEYPAVPGHEFAGVVDMVGSAVKGIKIGDRVTADNAYPCGHCHACKSGHPTFCSAYKCQGHNMQGGFAQYIACRADHVYPIPDSLSFDKACMSELVNCAISAVENSDVGYGENVVIIGAGSSGSMLAQLFKHSNAGRVLCIEKSRIKLERIAKAGVDGILINQEKPEDCIAMLKKEFPNGIDIIVDAAGDDGEMLESMMELLAPCGRLVLYSFFYFEPKYFRVQPGLMIKNGLKIVSAPLRTHTFGQCVDVLAQGKINMDLVISAVYPLSQYFDALDLVLNDPNVMKVIIHPNE